MNLRTPEGREALRQRISNATDTPLNLLAVVLLILLIIEFLSDTTAPYTALVISAGTVIWLIFLAEFVLELVLAANKTEFLKSHWLLAISVIVPFFRPLLALRALRASRLVTLFAGFGRGADILRDVFEGRGFLYVAILTAAVTVVSSAALFFVERLEPRTSFATYGDALWWTVATVTTVSTEGQPISLEGRIIGLVIMIYGLGVFGYVAATLASYFVGRQTKEEAGEMKGLQREIQDLKREVEKLTAAVEKNQRRSEQSEKKKPE